jgi:hypothetical protein
LSIAAGGLDVESAAVGAARGQQQCRGQRDRPPQISKGDNVVLYHKNGIFTMALVPFD